MLDGNCGTTDQSWRYCYCADEVPERHSRTVGQAGGSRAALVSAPDVVRDGVDEQAYDDDTQDRLQGDKTSSRCRHRYDVAESR